MKRILILVVVLSLIAAVPVMAATVGGQSNRYELRVDKITWHHSAWHADLNSVADAAARFQLWWSRYVKVDY